jgi:hypothetical protein
MSTRNRIFRSGFGLLLIVSLSAQTALPPSRLQISGMPGDAPVIRVKGRSYVDVEGLAQITGGSLSFRGNRVLLTLPGEPPATPAATAALPAGFSRNFMAAGIETIAAMREWGTTLVSAVQNGWEIRDSMNEFRDRAQENVELAAAAASTDDDRSGLDLLRREYENVKAWSDGLIAQRNSSSAGNLAVTENAVQQDPTFQNLVQCGRHLAQMFAGGRFQQSNACL